jgi:hypothetical protein
MRRPAAGYEDDMPRRNSRKQPTDPVEQLLRKLLIAQLTLARVPQGAIAKVLGISKTDVNAVARFIKLPKNT